MSNTRTDFAFGVLLLVILPSAVARYRAPTDVPTVAPTYCYEECDVPTAAPAFEPSGTHVDYTVHIHETEYKQDHYRFFPKPGGTFSHAVQVCEAQGSGWHIAYPTVPNKDWFLGGNVSKGGLKSTLDGDNSNGVTVMWMGAMRTPIDRAFRYIVADNTLGRYVSAPQGFWTSAYDKSDTTKNCVELNESAGGGFSNAPCDDVKRFACTNSAYLALSPMSPNNG
eukprot:m.78964 g.78964  ORF g.78964 m.78964 type:complete len:224 (-) comp25166_c0_seq1:275-946(-)